MPTIDFYILSATISLERQKFACRLLEKAYQAHHQVYVHCDSLLEAEALDELLWTYTDTSFVPHGLLTTGTDALPIHLGALQDPVSHQDVLLNLADKVPSWMSRFQRVLEIVIQEPQQLLKSRERYAYYRQAGCVIENHDLKQARSAHG